jgi:hypothetical protein
MVALVMNNKLEYVWKEVFVAQFVTIPAIARIHGGKPQKF